MVVLKAQLVTDATPYDTPLGSSMSRILYTTRNFNGTIVPASAYVLWPFMPRQFPNEPRHSMSKAPAILWSHGTRRERSGVGWQTDTLLQVMRTRNGLGPQEAAFNIGAATAASSLDESLTRAYSRTFQFNSKEESLPGETNAKESEQNAKLGDLNMEGFLEKVEARADATPPPPTSSPGGLDSVWQYLVSPEQPAARQVRKD
ncbi:hypothetical protein G7046_g5202 [Stylonectria norvegica]|nr:hypothetical protein G7046_g5202 [Stylonectria norvegica]